MATGAANRAASLTHRLLAFSRRQPLDPRPVNANKLFHSIEDLLKRTMGEAIDDTAWCRTRISGLRAATQTNLKTRC